MTGSLRVAIAVLGMTLMAAGQGLAAPSSMRGIAIDERIGADPLPSDLPAAVPVIVRLLIDEQDVAGSREAAVERVQQRLALYQARSIRVILAFGGFPATDDEVEPWREFVRTVVDRARGKVVAYQVGAVRTETLPDVNRYVYLLKLAAVQIKSVDVDAVVIQGTIPASAAEWQARVLATGTAPYVDGVALGRAAPEEGEPFSPMVQAMLAVIERDDPAAMVILGPIALSGDANRATSRLIETVLRVLGTKIQVTAYAGDEAVLKAALEAAGRVTDMLGDDLVTLDESSAALRILEGGADRTSRTDRRLLYSLTTFDTFLLYWGTSAADTIDIDITLTTSGTVRVRDPITGSSQPPNRIDGGQGKPLHLTVPISTHPLVVDFNFGAADVLAQRVDVQSEALPRIEEIIFRHQQAQAAQDAAVLNYIAHVRIEQHFHPSPADPSYNLITENRLFSERRSVEWEELSFELNGAKWTKNRPAFPLVQPEKVLSLPLDLRLNQDYTYRLAGVDTVGGRAAFVVRFDPVADGQALYRGTVWIDRRTYLRLKVQAVETQLSGPIVSNDETQLYEPVTEINERAVWLMNRVTSKQIFLIAGRNVLIEREVRVSDFMVNAAGFEAERLAARSSDRIMYRDTDRGVRYLVKKGDARVVSDQMTTSARAFALGAYVDPSFEFPLPIGGLNILDFNFLNRDMQLAFLFGGVVALGNIQRANLWGGKFDASVDFFVLAVKSSDDIFDAGGRRAGERVNRIPVATGFNIGYQLTPFHKISGHYEFKYDAYFRDVETDPGFAVPSSTVTNGASVGYEFRRRGYSLAANGAAYKRATWKAWGFGDGGDSAIQTYTKYDLGLSKDFIFATFHTIHLNGTYFGGQRLDRFSMYTFGLFDATRMHGVPSALRFAQLGMFRGSYSFNLFEQYRLDLFVEQASGRGAEGDTMWRPLTGTGVRVNFRAPRNTILQLDYGKSFLPGIYRSAGSNVLQIMLLKPL
jgi:hypothetical protein